MSKHEVPETPVNPAEAAAVAAKSLGDARVAEPKTKLRGVIHAFTTPVALIAGLYLLVRCDSELLRLGCAVWTITALMLFGNSAIYHLGTWSPRMNATLRRFDHSNIAIFIAGSYTPLALGMLQGTPRTVLLAVVWACAVAEVLFRTLWMGAPRWLYTALYLVMGWVAVFWLPTFWHTGGPAVVWLLILGGIFYSIGAIIYARKSPNPVPGVFGFHELFHTGTVLGAAAHWVAIMLVVL